MEKRQSAKERIELCFLELLQTKPVSKITVTEICTAVGVNRATFYKHYLDVFDLLEKIETELLEQLHAHLKVVTDDQYEDITYQMLAFLEEMDGRYWVLFAPDRGGDLATRAFELMHRQTFPILQSKLLYLPAEEAEMVYHFISRGFSGMVSRWLGGQRKQTAKQMAEMILHYSSAIIDGETNRRY